MKRAERMRQQRGAGRGADERSARPRAVLRDAIIEALERRQLLDAVPLGPETPVSATPGALNGSIAADDAGNSVVAWARPGSGDNAAVYAQRYDAAGTPLGSEFKVNTTPGATTSVTRVSIDADGDFVVVWVPATSGGTGTLRGQRFDAGGMPQGGEFVIGTAQFLETGTLGRVGLAMHDLGDFVVTFVSSSTSDLVCQRYDAAGMPQGGLITIAAPLGTDSFPTFSQVAMSDGGDFVVAFNRTDGIAQSHGVYARRYDAQGTALGDEFQVNGATGSGREPQVASSADGDFVIAWSGGGAGDANGVFARRYDSAGVAVGPEFLVNAYTTNAQAFPAVASDSSGNFLVSWDSVDQDGDSNGVYARLYNAVGQQVTAEFQVNTTTAGFQARAAATLDDDGDFTVVWRSGLANSNVHLQRFGFPQPTPAGAEFRVNSYTTGEQFATFASRSLAMDADGNFVVTWESDGQDGSVNGVYAQRYDASGAPVGSEFGVTTTTFGRQQDPSVAMDPDGEFVIVWQSNHLPGYFPNIYAQRYNAAGVPLGGEILVTQTTTVFNESPVVAMADDGTFLVSWESQRLGAAQYDVYARRYSASGAPLGGEFRINSATSHADRSPSVAMDADGDFVVTWMKGQGFFGYDIYARRFDPSGTPLGDDFIVNSLATEGQSLPSVDMDAGGNFVIAWESTIVNPLGFPDIYARRFDASGAPLGTEMLVNVNTDNFQRYPSVAVEPDGDFVVVYASDGVDGFDTGVAGRRFAADGTVLSAEFRVNSYTTGPQGIPSVACSAGGNLVVIWNSYGQDGDASGVYGQRYEQPAAPVSWDGGGNGTHWSDPLNWSTDALPGPTDDVVISVAANPTIIINDNVSVHSLTSDEAISLSSATLTLAADSAINADVTVNSGTLAGDGNLTLNGTTTWTFGSHQGNGTTIVPVGATMNITASLLVRTLEVRGTANHIGGVGENIYFGDNAGTPGSGVVHVLPGGVWNAVGGGDMGQLQPGGPHQFVNDGTMNRSGAETTFIGGIDVAFINNGTLNLDAGEIIFAIEDGFTNNGSIITAAGTTLRLNTDGTYAPASTINGSGSARFVFGTHTFSPGNYALTGPITLDGGEAVFNGPITVPSIQHNGGALGGSALVTVTDNYTWVNGTQRGSGTTRIAAGATMNITFGFLARTLEIAGTATHSGGPGDNIIFGDNIAALGEGRIQINPGGVWNSVGEGDMTQLAPGGPHAVVNNGTFNRSGAGTTFIGGFDVAFTNAGTLNLNEGSLVLAMEDGFTNDGSIVTSAGTSLTFGTDGTYGPASSISGPGAATFVSGTHTFGTGNYALTGPITLNGGIANFSDSFTVPDVTHNGGVLGGDGQLTVTGTYTQVNGIQRGGGKTIIPAGASMNITFVYLVRTLEIAGTATHSGGPGDNIFFGDNAGSLGSGMIHVLPGGVWNSVGQGAMGQLAPNGSPHQFVNNGTFNRSGAGTTFIGGFDVAFTNNGTLNLDEGGLQVSGEDGFTNNGSIVAAAGTLLSLNCEGTYGATSSITGAGAAQFVAGTHTFAAANYALTGPITLDGGIANFNGSFSVPSVTHNGGVLGGSGELTVTGNYTWVNGIQRGGGKTIIPTGATMNITFGYLVRTLEIAGTATHSGGPGDNIIFGDNAGSLGEGKIQINSGGVWNSIGQSAIGQLAPNGSQHQVLNNGTMNRSGAGTTFIGGFDVAFENNGMVNLNEGGLSLQMEDGFENNGAIITAGGTLLSLNTEGTYGAASTITGPGSIRFLSGTHTFAPGNYALTGPIALDGGTVNFNESLTVPSVTQSGILGGSGNLTVTGNYTWVQGIQRGSGKTIVPVGATMNITFGYLLRTLEIAGTATHSGVLGDRILLGDAQSVNGTIHVLPGGVFNLVGPVGITPAGGGGAQLLHNEGTITRTGADSSGIGGDGFSFDNAGTVDVQAGTLNLGVITLTNTGTLRAADGATLNLGNTTTLLAAGSIDGAGDVVFAGPAQWSGGTMTGTGRSIVETTGGLNLTGGGLRSSSREIDVRGFVAMQPGGALVLRTPALAIAPGAYLDVNDNALIVDYTGGTPQANIRAALTSGYNGGSWNGTGIRSSAAATTTTRALGYAEASAIFSNFPATFLGQQVDNTAVLVRYTRYGDADLSGNVNLNDFNRLATSFGQASTAWTQGNFNYDGFTNLNDFNLLAANFGQAAGPDGGVGGLERLRNMLPDEEADVFDEALA